jgi:hypothetical protein
MPLKSKLGAFLHKKNPHLSSQTDEANGNFKTLKK